MLEPSWAVLEFELASVLHCIVNSYWSRMQAGRIFRPTLQALTTLILPPSACRDTVHPQRYHEHTPCSALFATGLLCYDVLFTCPLMAMKPAQ